MWDDVFNGHSLALLCVRVFVAFVARNNHGWRVVFEDEHRVCTSR